MGYEPPQVPRTTLEAGFCDFLGVFEVKYGFFGCFFGYFRPFSGYFGLFGPIFTV